MKKIVILFVMITAAVQILAGPPARSPMVSLESSDNLQIMWEAPERWVSGGVLVCMDGNSSAVAEFWMDDNPGANYYYGYTHGVSVSGLECGHTYEYYLLGRDAEGNVEQIDKKAYKFTYPEQEKLARITDGPFLTNPDTDQMSVAWRTNTVTCAAVDIRIPGESNAERVIREDGRFSAIDNTNHIVHFTGLEPGMSYEYRAVVYDPEADMFIPSEEWRTFTTLSREKKTFRTLFFADIHGNDVMLEKMLNNFNSLDCDFVLFGGDMVWESMSKPNCQNLWGECLHLSAKALDGTVPLVMARGNHDDFGPYCDDYLNVLQTPEGKTWQAFRAGDFFFLILDSAGPADRTQLLSEQREWLKEVMNSDESISAEMRIIVTHASTHGQPDPFQTGRMREFFGDLLNDSDPSRRFVLCLAGHQHNYYRFNAGEDINRGEPLNPNEGRVPGGKDYNYTVMLNGGPVLSKWPYTVMEVTGEPGVVRVCIYDGQRNSLIDSIEIDADGNVTELGLHAN